MTWPDHNTYTHDTFSFKKGRKCVYLKNRTDKWRVIISCFILTLSSCFVNMHMYFFEVIKWVFSWPALTFFPVFWLMKPIPARKEDTLKIGTIKINILMSRQKRELQSGINGTWAHLCFSHFFFCIFFPGRQENKKKNSFHYFFKKCMHMWENARTICLV